ncbi:chitinase [Apiospora rasikravindrae]|uniref:Chitinase n=1 Tax=Apiospora rasikravindrae TaxID=990691 RepID=A0ABR1RVV6_9PEZI
MWPDRVTPRWLTKLILTFLIITMAYAAETNAAAAAADDHRVVVYYQTTNVNNSATDHISMLPLIDPSRPISVTHVLIAAIHIVDEQDGWIRLNDFPPANPRFDAVWSDAAQLQAAGVTVTAMIGGAAQGSFQRLDGDDAQFERYYGPLRDFLAGYNLQGVDLDVEEQMSLSGIVRLIDRLRADFGPSFVISLAPVGAALRKGGGNLSGFSYFDLEAQRGDAIDFYNAQFYFGWGSPQTASDYEDIVDSGFPAHKVTMGMLTSEENGSGFVPLDVVASTLRDLTAQYPDFGGVAAWEYFNSVPGGKAAPWEWAAWMAENMRGGAAAAKKASGVSFRLKRAYHDITHVARRWKSELWRWIK